MIEEEKKTSGEKVNEKEKQAEVIKDIPSKLQGLRDIEKMEMKPFPKEIPKKEAQTKEASKQETATKEA